VIVRRAVPFFLHSGQAVGTWSTVTPAVSPGVHRSMRLPPSPAKVWTWATAAMTTP